MPELKCPALTTQYPTAISLAEESYDADGDSPGQPQPDAGESEGPPHADRESGRDREAEERQESHERSQGQAEDDGEGEAGGKRDDEGSVAVAAKEALRADRLHAARVLKDSGEDPRAQQKRQAGRCGGDQRGRPVPEQAR